jgi:molybdate transport system substrate-binding protein
VLADPTVPAGNYSLQALDRLSSDPEYGVDFKEKVLANVVSREDNVRQVLAKVHLGEADAGIAYVTDVAAAEVKIIEIPELANVEALYYVAAAKEPRNPVAAQAFVSYLLSEEGQMVLERFGFEGGANR